jgi:hypothetical protein
LTTGRSTSGHLLVSVGHCRLARQSHATLFVHPEALNPDFIAHFDDVLRLFDPEVCQFTDVHQPILAGQEFHERAEILYGNNLATIDFPNLRFRRHATDRFAGDFHAVFGY